MKAIQKFIRDEQGVTAIEYGLIAALIAVVIIAAVKVIGTQLNITFGDVTPLPIPTFTPTSTGTPKPTVAIGTQTPRPSAASSAVPTLKGGVAGSPAAHWTFNVSPGNPVAR